MIITCSFHMFSLVKSSLFFHFIYSYQNKILNTTHIHNSSHFFILLKPRRKAKQIAFKFTMKRGGAERKRGGLITRRSVDQNHSPLNIIFLQNHFITFNCFSQFTCVFFFQKKIMR